LVISVHLSVQFHGFFINKYFEYLYLLICFAARKYIKTPIEIDIVNQKKIHG